MIKKFKHHSDNSINYAHTASSLFVTTPNIVTDLNLLTNEKNSLELTENYSQKTNDICFNADKIYGQKVLRMNESVFSGLFRHAEKVRIQNHVQEKMLHEAINGNKGMEKKLHQKLTKIERTRQSLEEELYYMEKEMKSLGLACPKRKDSNQSVKSMSDYPTKHTAVEGNMTASTGDLAKSFFKSQRSSLTNKSFDSVDIERKNSLSTSNMDLESISENNQQSRRDSCMKSDYKKYMRKGNSLVHFSHEPLHYTPKIRKFSLGNHNSSTTSASTLSKARSQSIYSSDPASLFKNSLIHHASSSSDAGGSVFGDTTRATSPATGATTTGHHYTTSNAELHLAHKNAEPTFSPRILQLPKIDQIYADRRKRSRKVSFTQVDLNELEIPKTYMHSNEALEKYKFNSEYYHPDGNLKTKFLLPQLKDSLEMAKNCRYIRQYSIDSGHPSENDDDIVKYVFHDSINHPPTIN